jgi:hypothetical protein
MHGVTTALVAFIFFCVVFPQRVKNRAQFYAGFFMVCLIILLDALGVMISGWEWKGFRVFAYFAVAGLQIGAILILFMAAGGLSWQDLKGEMGEAIEVIRRGGEEKEVIIPLTGAKPKQRDDDTVDEEPPRVRIDLPGEITSPRSPPPAKPRDDSSLPLE